MIYNINDHLHSLVTLIKHLYGNGFSIWISDYDFNSNADLTLYHLTVI